jgi:hypothetical protein
VRDDGRRWRLPGHRTWRFAALYVTGPRSNSPAG